MPSIRVEESITIARGLEAVFDEITDPKTWTRGEPGVRFVGPQTLSQGARIRAELETGGKVHESEATVTAFERPNRFGMSVRGEPFNLQAIAVIKDDPVGTRLTVAVELSPSRWIHGLSVTLGGGFLRRGMAKVVAHKLVELKTELEAAT